MVSLPPILSQEEGQCSVGEYSNFKLGRAVFESYEGHLTFKECGDKWGFKEEVVDYARRLYSRILLYLGAEAVKASPYLTTLGIFDRVSNAEDFVQLRGIVEDYLREDDRTPIRSRSLIQSLASIPKRIRKQIT